MDAITLTWTHLGILAALGLAYSAGLAMGAEWLARRFPASAPSLRTWGPMALGLPIGLGGFTLAVEVVAGLSADLSDWRWWVVALAAHVIGAAGSKVAYETAGPLAHALLSAARRRLDPSSADDTRRP